MSATQSFCPFQKTKGKQWSKVWSWFQTHVDTRVSQLHVNHIAITQEFTRCCKAARELVQSLYTVAEWVCPGHPGVLLRDCFMQSLSHSSSPSESIPKPNHNVTLWSRQAELDNPFVFLNCTELDQCSTCCLIRLQPLQSPLYCVNRIYCWSIDADDFSLKSNRLSAAEMLSESGDSSLSVWIYDQNAFIYAQPGDP